MNDKIKYFIKLKIDDLKNQIKDLEYLVKDDDVDENMPINEVYEKDEIIEKRKKERQIKLFDFYNNYSNNKEFNNYINFDKLFDIFNKINDSINNINKTLSNNNNIEMQKVIEKSINKKEEEEEERKEREEKEREKKEREEKERKEREEKEREEKERKEREEKEREEKEREEKEREEKERKKKERKEKERKEREEKEREEKEREEKERKEREEKEINKMTETIFNNINKINDDIRKLDNYISYNKDKKIESIKEQINMFIDKMDQYNKDLETVDNNEKKKNILNLKINCVEQIKSLIDNFKKTKNEIEQNEQKKRNLLYMQDIIEDIKKFANFISDISKKHDIGNTINDYKNKYNEIKTEYDNFMKQINDTNNDQKSIKDKMDKYNIYKKIQTYRKELNDIVSKKIKEEEKIKEEKRKEEEKKEKERKRKEKERKEKERKEKEKEMKEIKLANERFKKFIKDKENETLELQKKINDMYKNKKTDFITLQNLINSFYNKAKKNYTALSENNKKIYKMLNELEVKLSDGWIGGLKMFRDLIKYELIDNLNEENIKKIDNDLLLTKIFIYDYINKLETNDFNELKKQKKKEIQTREYFDSRDKDKNDLQDEAIIRRLQNRKQRIMNLIHNKRFNINNNINDIKTEFSEYKNDLNLFMKNDSDNENREYNENEVIKLNDNFMYEITNNTDNNLISLNDTPNKYKQKIIDEMVVPFNDIRDQIANLNAEILEKKENKINKAYLRKLFNYTSLKDLTPAERITKEKEFYDDPYETKLKRRREQIYGIIQSKRKINDEHKNDSINLINIMNKIEDNDIKKIIKNQSQEILNILSIELPKNEKIEKIKTILKNNSKDLDKKIDDIF